MTYNRERIKEKLQRDFSDLGKTRLRRYPLEEEFSTPFFRFYTVPQGWNVVNLSLGGRLPLLSNIPLPSINQYDSKGNPIINEITGKPEKIRINLSRKVKGPGLRFMLGGFGLLKSAYVVNKQMQTHDLCMQQVATSDGVQLPQVDATLNYRVIDSIKAMAGATDYRETAFEIAGAVVIGEVGKRTLKQNLELMIELDGKTDLAEQTRKKDTIYTELRDVGVRLEGLYLTNIDLPDDLEKALARMATADAEAKGIKIIAEARKYEAEQLAEAASAIEKTPIALQLRALEALENTAKSEKGATIVFPGIPGLERIFTRALK